MSRPCPCTSKLPFDQCCEPYLKGIKRPDTAERLMRSRFTAYAEAKVDYLIETTAAEAREKIDRADLVQYCRGIRCVGLKILKTEQGGPSDETGTVLFHASLQHNGRRLLHRELSRFCREAGQWRYIDGETND